MGKNIVIFSTSLRPGSNSQTLAQAFAEGAAAAGHSVTIETLSGKTLQFCRGCLGCIRTHRCCIEDDAAALIQAMARADVLVFATPIYYYEMSGQLKTLLDRSNPLYGTDYRFRDVYFLATAAEEGDDVWARAVGGLEGWIACFDQARLAGVVFAGGVNAPREIENHPALQRASSMGASIEA